MSGGYSVTNNVFAEIEIPEKGILSQTLYSDDNIRIILFGFAPGQELTAHTAPMPAIIQLLEGEATLTLGADVVEVQGGCVVHMEPLLNHALVARSRLRMLLTLVKAASLDTNHVVPAGHDKEDH